MRLKSRAEVIGRDQVSSRWRRVSVPTHRRGDACRWCEGTTANQRRCLYCRCVGRIFLHRLATATKEKPKERGIMLTQHLQTRLKDLVRPRINGAYQATTNRKLDELIEQMQAQYPEFFHQDSNSLRKRTFFDEPVRLPGHSPMPMAAFIKPRKGWRSE